MAKRPRPEFQGSNTNLYKLYPVPPPSSLAVHNTTQIFSLVPASVGIYRIRWGLWSSLYIALSTPSRFEKFKNHWRYFTMIVLIIAGSYHFDYVQSPLLLLSSPPPRPSPSPHLHTSSLFPHLPSLITTSLRTLPWIWGVIMRRPGRVLQSTTYEHKSIAYPREISFLLSSVRCLTSVRIPSNTPPIYP